MAVEMTKITVQADTTVLAKYGECCTIAGFRLAVDTLAYGQRSGALGLYDSPEEYLREVLKEMETAHAPVAD